MELIAGAMVTSIKQKEQWEVAKAIGTELYGASNFGIWTKDGSEAATRGVL